jgi:hypothetical protein
MVSMCSNRGITFDMTTSWFRLDSEDRALTRHQIAFYCEVFCDLVLSMTLTELVCARSLERVLEYIVWGFGLRPPRLF